MLKLIIIDDDEIICRGIAVCIDWPSYGVEVVDTAFDGELGLLSIEKHQPDIIIVDINMPFMDGMELSDIVRQRYPHIKIILLTAYKEFSYAQRAVDLQVFRYISKPFDNEEVVRAVTNAAHIIVSEQEYRTELEKRSGLIRRKYLSELASSDTGEQPAASIPIVVEDADFRRCRQEIIEGAKESDFTRIREAVEALFQNIMHTGEPDPAAIYFMAIELIIAAYKEAGDDTLYDEFLSAGLRRFEEFANANDIAEIQRLTLRHMEPLRKYFSSLDSDSLKSIAREAAEYIDHYYDNPELTLKTVSDAVNVSSGYLCIIFKKYNGLSYISYLNRARMENAKRLLGQSDIRTYEVAFRVGYNSSQYFASSFKKYTGMTPGEYRAKRRTANEHKQHD